jgi:uncharacterized protein
MPVRSLNSSVLKWPDRKQVEHAIFKWVAAAVEDHPEIVQIAIFGSYAHGKWGVGSDLDLIMIVTHDADSFGRRAVKWDLNELPVPADLVVYTLDERQLLQNEGGVLPAP